MSQTTVQVRVLPELAILFQDALLRAVGRLQHVDDDERIEAHDPGVARGQARHDDPHRSRDERPDQPPDDRHAPDHDEVVARKMGRMPHGSPIGRT